MLDSASGSRSQLGVPEAKRLGSHTATEVDDAESNRLNSEQHIPLVILPFREVERKRGDPALGEQFGIVDDSRATADIDRSLRRGVVRRDQHSRISLDFLALARSAVGGNPDGAVALLVQPLDHAASRGAVGTDCGEVDEGHSAKYSECMSSQILWRTPLTGDRDGAKPEDEAQGRVERQIPYRVTGPRHYFRNCDSREREARHDQSADGTRQEHRSDTVHADPDQSRSHQARAIQVEQADDDESHSNQKGRGDRDCQNRAGERVPAEHGILKRSSRRRRKGETEGPHQVQGSNKDQGDRNDQSTDHTGLNVHGHTVSHVQFDYAARMALRRSDRLTREKWADAALLLLAQEGVGAVTIERVSSSLAVTKGSAYHHFSSRNELVEAALGRWEERATHAIIVELSQIEAPRNRLRAILAVTVGQNREPLSEYLVISSTDALAAPFIERVTAARLQFLEAIYLDFGLTNSQAALWAIDCYSGYLGVQTLRETTQDGQVLNQLGDEYLGHLLTRLTPSR